jgi:hypothetical protein
MASVEILSKPAKMNSNNSYKNVLRKIFSGKQIAQDHFVRTAFLTIL